MLRLHWRLVAILLLCNLVAHASSAEQKKKMGKDRPDTSDPKLAYGWSYYRYTKYKKEPHQQDKQASMLAGGDIKCDVCEVILAKTLQDLTKASKLNGGTMDQDNIEEALEADAIDQEKVEKAADRMEEYVERYKKGCNKLFKDNFLALGWDAVACHNQVPFDMVPQPPNGRIPWACARDVHEAPSKEDMNTYTVERESIHYACEATITRHRDELARFVAEHYEEYKKSPPKKLAAAACKEAAKCKVRKPTETIEARARKMAGYEDSRNEALDKELRKYTKQVEKAEKEAKTKRKKKNKEKENDEGSKEDRVEL